jgi:hypothetical protein
LLQPNFKFVHLAQAAGAELRFAVHRSSEGLAEAVKPGQVYVRIANRLERPAQLLPFFVPTPEDICSGWILTLFVQPILQCCSEAQGEAAQGMDAPPAGFPGALGKQIAPCSNLLLPLCLERDSGPPTYRKRSGIHLEPTFLLSILRHAHWLMEAGRSFS